MKIRFEKREEKNAVVLDGEGSITFFKSGHGIDIKESPDVLTEIKNFRFVWIGTEQISFKDKIRNLKTLWKYMK